jgi:hypothetical protein
MALVLASASSAAAQTPLAPPATKVVDESPSEPRWSFAFGYPYFHDGAWDTELLYGLFTNLSFRITRNMHLFAELQGSHGFYSTTDFTIQRYSLMGGFKLLAGEGRIRPFFHGMFGITRQGGDVGLADGIALQGGGGAEFTINARWAVRGQADYRVMYENEEIYTGYRFAGSLAIYLGKGVRR